jgi:hypothetical protein
VTLRDAEGEEVARATLHSLVGPKPGKGQGKGTPERVDRRDVN